MILSQVLAQPDSHPYRPSQTHSPEFPRGSRASDGIPGRNPYSMGVLEFTGQGFEISLLNIYYFV